MDSVARPLGRRRRARDYIRVGTVFGLFLLALDIPLARSSRSSSKESREDCREIDHEGRLQFVGVKSLIARHDGISCTATRLAEQSARLVWRLHLVTVQIYSPPCVR